jgi:hypothetical protein
MPKSERALSASRRRDGGTCTRRSASGRRSPQRPDGDIAGALAAHFQQAGDDRRAVRYLTEAVTRRVADTPTPRQSGSRARARHRRALPTASAGRTWSCSSSSAPPPRHGDVRGSIETSRRAPLRPGARCGDEEVRAELGGALPGDRTGLMSSRLAPASRAWRCRRTSPVPPFQRIVSRGWRDEDAETCRLSLDIVRRAGERRHLSLHVGHYALLQSHRSEYRAACRTAEQGLRLAVEVRDAYLYMTAQFYRAWACCIRQWELRRVSRRTHGGAATPPWAGIRFPAWLSRTRVFARACACDGAAA